MNKIFGKVFLWMALGLLITFITGYTVSLFPNMLMNIFGGIGYLILAILEIIVVIYLATRIFKMAPNTAKATFLLYSFISGLTFSSIFITYEVASIIYVFLIASFLFAIMGILGYKTQIDLSKIGTYFLIGLIGIIIMYFINIFIGSNTLDLFLSALCIILFLGITAHDIQKIKRLDSLNLPQDNLAIYGALELYLDFINIFIDLLRLFGRNND